MAQIYLGTANVGIGGAMAKYSTVESLNPFVSTFQRYNHRIVDTARAYPPLGQQGTSEEILGHVCSSLSVSGLKNGNIISPI